MGVFRALGMAARRWYLLVPLVLVAVGVAWLVYRQMPATYTATVVHQVAIPADSSGPSGSSGSSASSGSGGEEGAGGSGSAVANASALAAELAREVAPPPSRGLPPYTVSIRPDTPLIRVQAQSDNPAGALDTVNSVSDRLRAQLVTAQTNQGVDGAATLDTPQPASVGPPVRTTGLKVFAATLLFGLLLAVVFAAAVERSAQRRRALLGEDDEGEPADAEGLDDVDDAGPLEEQGNADIVAEHGSDDDEPTEVVPKAVEQPTPATEGLPDRMAARLPSGRAVGEPGTWATGAGPAAKPTGRGPGPDPASAAELDPEAPTEIAALAPVGVSAGPPHRPPARLDPRRLSERPGRRVVIPDAGRLGAPVRQLSPPPAGRGRSVGVGAIGQPRAVPAGGAASRAAAALAREVAEVVGDAAAPAGDAAALAGDVGRPTAPAAQPGPAALATPPGGTSSPARPEGRSSTAARPEGPSSSARRDGPRSSPGRDGSSSSPGRPDGSSSPFGQAAGPRSSPARAGEPLLSSDRTTALPPPSSPDRTTALPPPDRTTALPPPASPARTAPHAPPPAAQRTTAVAPTSPPELYHAPLVNPFEAAGSATFDSSTLWAPASPTAKGSGFLPATPLPAGDFGVSADEPRERAVTELGGQPWPGDPDGLPLGDPFAPRLGPADEEPSGSPIAEAGPDERWADPGDRDDGRTKRAAHDDGRAERAGHDDRWPEPTDHRDERWPDRPGHDARWPDRPGHDDRWAEPADQDRWAERPTASDDGWDDQPLDDVGDDDVESGEARPAPSNAHPDRSTARQGGTAPSSATDDEFGWPEFDDEDDADVESPAAGHGGRGSTTASPSPAAPDQPGSASSRKTAAGY